MLDIAPLLNTRATLVTVTAGELDANLDPTETTTETDIWCTTFPVAPGEITDRADLAVDRLTIYLAPDSTVAAGDRLTLRDERWEFVGTPEAWRHPRTDSVVYRRGTIARVA